MRGPAIFVLAVVVLLAIAVGGVVYVVANAAPAPRGRVLVAPITVEPELVELGNVSQCGDLIAVRARLLNTSDEVFHINQVVVGCGCTVPDLVTPLRLDPGVPIDFTVALDPWATSGAAGQQIDFIYAEASRGPPFRIRYTVDSPLRTLPGGAHRHDQPTAVIKVTSDDAKTFTIRSVDPPVVEDWVRTPTSETHLTIDWAAVDEIAPTRPDLFEFDDNGHWRRGKMAIGTDIEGCPAIHLRLYNDQDFVAPSGATPGPLAQPVKPSTGAPDAPTPPAPSAPRGS